MPHWTQSDPTALVVAENDGNALRYPKGLPIASVQTAIRMLAGRRHIAEPGSVRCLAASVFGIHIRCDACRAEATWALYLLWQVEFPNAPSRASEGDLEAAAYEEKPIFNAGVPSDGFSRADAARRFRQTWSVRQKPGFSGRIACVPATGTGACAIIRELAPSAQFDCHKRTIQSGMASSHSSPEAAAGNCGYDPVCCEPPLLTTAPFFRQN